MLEGAIFIANDLARPVENVLGSVISKYSTPFGYILQRFVTTAVLPVPVGPTINPNVGIS